MAVRLVMRPKSLIHSLAEAVSANNSLEAYLMTDVTLLRRDGSSFYKEKHCSQKLYPLQRLQDGFCLVDYETWCGN